MNVNIDLPDHIGNQLAQRAAAAGMDLSRYVAELMAERLDDDPVEQAATAAHEAFMTRLHQTIALHRPSFGRLDDSRESIYAGCGE